MILYSRRKTLVWRNEIRPEDGFGSYIKVQIPRTSIGVKFQKGELEAILEEQKTSRTKSFIKLCTR